MLEHPQGLHGTEADHIRQGEQLHHVNALARTTFDTR